MLTFGLFPLSKTPLTSAERFVAFCGWALFILTSIWVIYFVPMNMDEASPYHLLACYSHPASFLHIFREGCFPGHANLVTPFGLYMARSYPYLGALSSFLYAPFYYLAPTSYASLYWFGLGCFALYAVLMSRFTAKPQLSLPLILAFFPFLFQFIHNEGVVRISLLLFPLTAMLFKRFMDSERPQQYGYAFLLAVLLLAGMENKIFVLHLLPVIACFSLATLNEPGWKNLFLRLRRAMPPLAVGLFLLGTGTLLLLSSTLHYDDTTHSYIHWLQNFAEKRFSFSDLAQWFLLYLFFWGGYAHFIFALDLYAVTVVFGIVLMLAYIFLCLFFAFEARLLTFRLKPRAFFLLLGFAILSVIFFIIGSVWAGHHFVFLFVPISIYFLDFLGALRSGRLVLTGSLFLLFNAFSVLYLTQQNIVIPSSPEREVIFNYLAEEVPPSQALVNFSAWGGYYHYSLFAPKNQLVTYIDPITPEDAAKLVAIAKNTSRTIYNVCYGLGCDKESLEQAFDRKVVFQERAFGLENWRLFVASPRH